MATYYFRNAGVNWGDAANWSLTDGGGATGAVPTAADDAYFTSNSGNCTINASNRVCKTLIFSGVGAGNYTGTVTMTFSITVSGNITLSGTMGNFSGSGTLTTGATSTFTSNGKAFPNAVILGANTTFADTFDIGDFDCRVNNGTHTLSASGTCNTLTNNFGGGTFATIINGALYTLSIRNNLTVGIRSITGTANLKMICSSGTGTWSSAGQVLSNPLEIDATANITVSGTVQWTGTGTLKWTAVGGAFTTTGSTLAIGPGISGTGTLDLANSTWGTLSFLGGANTFLNTSGTPTFTSVINTNVTVAITMTGNINVSGGATLNGSRSLDGTGTINFTGTGTITGSSGWATNVTVNTIGTITFGTFTWGAASRTWTHTSGTTAPGTGTFTVNTGSTFSVGSSGFIVYNFAPLTGTHTINTGTITVNNNLTFNGNTTFAGTGGWEVNNLTDSTAGRTLSLKDGSTYTVTGTLSLTGTNASRWTIASSSATLRALLTLNQGASQSLIYVNGTRIDSSAGQTVWSLGGTLTDTVNWNNGSRPAPFNSIRMG